MNLVPLWERLDGRRALLLSALLRRSETTLHTPSELVQSEWLYRSENFLQFATGINTVIYPDLPLDSGFIELKLKTDAQTEGILLTFKLYAEEMPGKQFSVVVDPSIM